MKWRMLLGAAALVGITAFVTREVVSQDQPAPSKSERERSGPSATGSAESMVEALVRYAMPGEHHKLLGKMAGRWNMAIKYWMNAEAPAVESKGTCERKWILGNRFVLEEFDGGNLGLPYQGLAVYGYDAFEEKYTSAWVDTMSTAITTNLGTCQAPCEAIAFVGRHGDPWSGTKRNSRGITRFVSDDQHVLEVYEPGSDGKEYKILEIVYTRPTGMPTSAAGPH